MWKFFAAMIWVVASAIALGLLVGAGYCSILWLLPLAAFNGLVMWNID